MKPSTYTVYIRWGGNSMFSVPVKVEAASLDDAAKYRIALLDSPDHYDDVLVVGGGFAETFAIRDFTPSKQLYLAPKPRYGWRRS